MTAKDPAGEPDDQPESVAAMSGRRGRLWRWFDRRTGVSALLHKSLDEPIPGGARFAYVFGSALLFLLVSQIITGVCLAVYYVPSPATAHVTLGYIIKEVAGGAFLRSLHLYGSSAMVVVLVLHFLQTLLYGSYKGKRELLWVSGCVLSMLILGMTFTGYLLRWDLKAYFAGSVGTSIAGDVPLIGGWLLKLLRGGELMGALTLSRFYVLHVFLLPATIFLFIAVHIWMFRKAGAAGPMGEDPVRPRLPTQTFYPRQVIIDMAFVLLVMGVLGMLAHFVPATLGPVADPSNSTFLPRPEWYYLPFFQWLKFWNGAKTVIGVVVIPAVLIGLVIVLPFFDRGRERRPWKRVIPVGSVLIVLIGLIGLGMQSRLDDSRDPATASQIAQQDLAEAKFLHAPFEPQSTDSLSPTEAPVALSSTAKHGESLFASQSCTTCHGASGAGGKGPALTHITDRFPPAKLTAMLQTPSAPMKAGGMVPLTLNAADLAALVSYLGSLGGTSAAPPAPTTTAAAPPADTAAKTGNPPARSHAAGAGGSPIAAAASVVPAGDSAATMPGELIYQSAGCAACHGVGGQGTPRGPVLDGIGRKLSAAQMTTLFHAPTAAMKAGGMPPVTGTAASIGLLVSYVRSLNSAATKSGKPVPGAPAPDSPAQAGTPGTLVSPAKRPPAHAEPDHAPTKPSVAAGDSAMTGQPTHPPSQRGEAIFVARGCPACHGTGGVGTKTGPALTALGTTLTPAALTTLLEHPNQKMKAGGMPATVLSATDMSALVAYLQDLGTSRAPPPAGAIPPAQPDSSAPAIGASQRAMNELELRGELIFRDHSCGTCHGMGGVGGTWAAPALANTGKNYTPALLTELLQHPTARMQQGGMPRVSLSGDQLNALVAYVRRISAAKPAGAPAQK